MGKKQKNKSEDSAKDDIDLDALAAEIEGAGAAKEQEPQKSKGKKKKEKKRQDFDEDDILKELEELSWEAQGIKADRETAAVKPTENNEDESTSKQDKKRKDRKAKNKVLKIMIVKNWKIKIQNRKRLQSPKWKCTLRVMMMMILIKSPKKLKGKLKNQTRNGMGQKRMKLTVKELKSVPEYILPVKVGMNQMNFCRLGKDRKKSEK